MSLIVVGIAFDRVRFAERQKLVLASALLAGAAIFPFGVLLQIFDHGAIPRGIAILGSLLVIAALLGVALGLAARQSREELKPANHSSFS
jgi:hypothetical protein